MSGCGDCKETKIILDLCGGTGSWSRPFALSNYDVRTYEPPPNVWGILAAPPCTEFSVLNCKAEARKRDECVGLEIVIACLRIIIKAKPKWWAMENPRGFLRKYMGDPVLSFQPWHYGDPWTKATDIWGDFRVPPKKYERWEDVPDKLALYTRPNREKPNFAYLHKSAQRNIPQLSWANPQTDADFRAITPPGFSRAFFVANQ